jgi:hypothetical protein
MVFLLKMIIGVSLPPFAVTQSTTVKLNLSEPAFEMITFSQHLFSIVYRPAYQNS